MCGEDILAVEDRCTLSVYLLACADDVGTEAGALFRRFEFEEDETAVVLARVLNEEEAPDLVAKFGWEHEETTLGLIGWRVEVHCWWFFADLDYHCCYVGLV